MCSTVPLEAISLRLFVRQAMPMPVVIKPICDTEEQARVFFRLPDNSARKAPRNIVTAPSARMAAAQCSSPASMPQQMMSMP